jgi:hypothetical protein
MSHFTELSTRITDPDMLVTCLREITPEEPQIRFTHEDGPHSKILKIQIADSSEATFQYTGHKYDFVTDLMEWTGPNSVTEFLNSVHQRYTQNTIKKMAKTYNFDDVQTNKLPTGEIRMVISDD